MALKDYYTGCDDAEWNSVDYRRDMRDWDYWAGVHAYEQEQKEAAAERRRAEVAREQREQEEYEEYERAMEAEYNRQMEEDYNRQMAADGSPCPEAG